MMEAAREWHQRARVLLADGLRYTASLWGTKLRVATGLPALLGLRTLRDLEAADWSALVAGVKISRSQVKRAFAAAFARSMPILPGSWQRCYRRACKKAIG